VTEPNAASSDFGSWPPATIANAAAQLAREFPNVEFARVSAAVNAAALRVGPADGQVRLMRTARDLLPKL